MSWGKGGSSVLVEGLTARPEQRRSPCRLSFWANQVRLFLHAAAYWLLDTLRRRLGAQGYPPLQLDTLRLRLLKIGGRVRELLTRVRLHLASGHPGQHLWDLLAAARPRAA